MSAPHTDMSDGFPKESDIDFWVERSFNILCSLGIGHPAIVSLATVCKLHNG